MKLGDKVCVFKGTVTRRWTWACPSLHCQAPTHLCFGRGTHHWELALTAALDHIAEWHRNMTIRPVPHDPQTPPGGFHLGDNEATLSLPKVPEQRITWGADTP